MIIDFFLERRYKFVLGPILVEERICKFCEATNLSIIEDDFFFGYAVQLITTHFSSNKIFRTKYKYWLQFIYEIDVIWWF